MGFAITPITGKSGRFQSDAGIISIEDEQVEFKRDRIEVTGTEDQKADGSTPQNLATGVSSMSGTINAAVNADQLAAGVLGIKDGDVLTNVKFFLDKALAARWCGASKCLVLSVKYMGKIKDKWMYSLQIESTGGFNCVITHPS